VKKQQTRTFRGNNFRIGIIGCGNMGYALLEGLIYQKVLPRRNIYVSDINTKLLNQVQKKFKITPAENSEIAKSCEVVIIAVKPQQVPELLTRIKENFSSTILISLAAGLTTRFLESCILPKKIPVIRVMPNLLVKVKQGVIGYCPGRMASGLDFLVEKIFRPVGKVIKIQEGKMDFLTAISGSGPGYLFYLAELLEKIARKRGFDAKTAKEMISSLFLGTGLLLKESKESAEELKRRVCSPGGTTLAGLSVLEKKKFPGILEKVIQQAEKRSRQLSK